MEILSSRPMLVHRVAVRLGLSRRMIRHLAATGVLPGQKKGVKIWCFDPREVEAYRLRREHAGQSDAARSRSRPPAVEIDLLKHPNGKLKRLTIRLGVPLFALAAIVAARAFGLDVGALLRALLMSIRH